MVRFKGTSEPSQDLIAKVSLACCSNLNAVSPRQRRTLNPWSDESPKAVGELNDTINSESLGELEWWSRTKSNNSFNPTFLSLAFINLVPCDVSCVISSGGGLIRALDS